LRPAIVLIGVAYEIAIEAAIEKLIAKAILQAADLQLPAARRIEKVKSVIGSVLKTTEERFAAEAAYGFADTLRRRRNDGSHTRPTYPFDDHDEVEEFLMSASRHLPPLWSIAR
jgi:hypothetical protein